MGSSIGGLVGGAAGAFFGGPAGATIGSQLGGIAGSAIGGSRGGSSAARAQGNAAQAISGAGQTGQLLAQFRPVGITTSFGRSNFGYDPTTGQMTSAGYSLSPQLQALQNQVMGNYGNAYNQAQDISNAYSPMQGGASQLFNLGQQYLSTSPEAAAATWLQNQRTLLAPKQQQDLAAMRNQAFRTGRTGLATGGTASGMAATNPEMAAYYNSLAQQENQLAASADQYGMQRIQFGAGLFGTGGGLLDAISRGRTAAYSPLQAQLGLSNAIEGMGQNAFDLSSALGARSSAAGGTAGQIGLAGARTSSPFMVEQQSYNPLSQILGGTSSSSTGALGGQLGNWFSDIIGGGSGMGLLNKSRTSTDYMENIGATSSGPLGTSNPYANESWM